MSAQTGISWCDSTFNPWIGCTKVSPACDHCYAERDMAIRRRRVEWGAGKPRSRTSAANWKLPERWNRRRYGQCPRCGWRGEYVPPPQGIAGCPDCTEAEVSVMIEAARRRVFSSSLADWLDNEVPIEWLADLLDTIRRTPNLDWLLLTKRIGNLRPRLSSAASSLLNPMLGPDFSHALRDWLSDWLDGNPPPNVWLGATVVNQEEVDRDAPKLLGVPAAVRFLSVEPMLGPINLSMWRDRVEFPSELHWVIPGFESGPRARPGHVEWIRSLVQQCKAAGVAVHVKQLGKAVHDDGMSGPGEHWPTERRVDTGRGHFTVTLKDPKGGDVSEWPEDLRVQEFPRNTA